ncbi:MAG: hypothetical protein ACRDM7_08085, partial [Thermoleophilaceae bacterium]
MLATRQVRDCPVNAISVVQFVDLAVRDAVTATLCTYAVPFVHFGVAIGMGSTFCTHRRINP